MARLWRSLLARRPERRFGLPEYQGLFGDSLWPLVSTAGPHRSTEDIETSFAAYVQQAYKRNGVVFAVVLARMLLFSEARFMWQRLERGRPGDLFSNRELEVLERPWPNGTTGELLARMEQDVSMAGNAYVVREPGPPPRLRRLRPDWVTIVLSAPPAEAVECDVVGYLYHPGGVGAGVDPVAFLPERVAHFAPVPDPEAQYRGMSWVTPVLREVQADGEATEHKLSFFRNGATLSYAVTLPESVTPQQFGEFVRKFRDAHQGTRNAYEPLFFGAGADITSVGADLKQLDFKLTQGAGETRLCAAGGVPPIIVGLSEGLQAATYSNYGMARRKFGDHWARPQWREAAGALETILQRPGGGVRLWYDDRDIPFLREDEKDRAEIQGVEARTIRTLVDGGYEGESVVSAVMAADWSLLRHTGLFSVQLLPPEESGVEPDTGDQPTESEDEDGDAEEEPADGDQGDE